MKINQNQLTFYLNVYNDYVLIPDCLIQLRKVYPNSRVVMRSDGDRDPELKKIAQQYNSEFYDGERLMLLERGGEIVHEMLRLFLKQPTPYLFKIDPDTRISRPFQALPTYSCVFGTLQHHGNFFSVQGGCIGFTLKAAQEIFQSGLCLDPEFCECPPPWSINEALMRRPMELGLTSIDWVLGWVCRKLSMELVDWPEIMSEWQVTPENEDLRYAVTHPHKPEPVITGIKRCAVRYWENVDSITGHSIF